MATMWHRREKRWKRKERRDGRDRECRRSTAWEVDNSCELYKCFPGLNGEKNREIWNFFRSSRTLLSIGWGTGREGLETHSDVLEETMSHLDDSRDSTQSFHSDQIRGNWKKVFEIIVRIVDDKWWISRNGLNDWDEEIRSCPMMIQSFIFSHKTQERS